MIDKNTLWLVIMALGLGSFLLRFSFIGLVGNRPLPPWLLRYLRYTAVAIIPALIAPLVAFSNESATGPEPVRLLSALLTLCVGIYTRNVIYAILAGAVTLSLLTLI